MGFSLKKAVNSVVKTVTQPQNLLFPTSLAPTDAIIKATGNANGLYGKPGSTAPNPYGAPNLGYLADTTKLDPLKDSSKYDFLRDTSKFDFLKSPAPTNQYASTLPSSAATFASRYTAPTKTSDSMFNDLIGKINAPSSVDSVQSSIDSDRMKQLLEGIGQDENQSLASSKLDFLDRGLGGPGMISDIEANALAQSRSGADKLRAGARTDFASKELDRLKAQEEAARGAYGQRYQSGVAADTQAADIASRGALADASSYNDLLGTQAKLADTSLDRSNTRDLALADLTQKGNQAYADTSSSRDNLYAQLLNARDLGAAGVQTDLFNSAANRQQAGQKPSLFDQLLNHVSIGV